MKINLLTGYPRRWLSRSILLLTICIATLSIVLAVNPIDNSIVNAQPKPTSPKTDM